MESFTLGLEVHAMFRKYALLSVGLQKKLGFCLFLLIASRPVNLPSCRCSKKLRAVLLSTVVHSCDHYITTRKEFSTAQLLTRFLSSEEPALPVAETVGWVTGNGKWFPSQGFPGRQTSAGQLLKDIGHYSKFIIIRRNYKKPGTSQGKPINAN